MKRKDPPPGKLIPLRRVGGRADELSDEALMAAAAAGEVAALGALFDRHGARTATFLRRISRGDRADVSDLLQVTFLEVQRSSRRFRKQSRVSTWIMGIAAHVASHHRRGEQRRHRAEAALALCPSARIETPGEQVQRSELLARLSAGIDALPPELRVVYVMCEIEDVPGKEAAGVLGITEGTLWRRMHEARRALRAAIAGEDP
jgi:RNA polymerase sigma-70 factor (ECF subfamily)